MKELVSVIVPVYNSGAYLEKCIQSITNQTYENLEIILINDGSTDQSGTICDKYAQKDCRVKVIHKNNEGVSIARNRGFELSRGQKICFVDSDDWIEENMIEQMVIAMYESNKKIAVCGRYNVDSNTGIRTKQFCSEELQVWSREEAIQRTLTYSGIDTSPCDKMYERELLDGREIFKGGLICEDIIPIFSIILKSNGVVHIGVPMYNYLQREQSRSRSSFDKKTLGLVEYPNIIREVVKREYPQFEREANWYYAINLQTMLTKMNPQGPESVLYKKYILELRKYVRYILSEYSTIQQKLINLLLMFKLFHLLKRIKNGGRSKCFFL